MRILAPTPCRSRDYFSYALLAATYQHRSIKPLEVIELVLHYESIFDLPELMKLEPVVNQQYYNGELMTLTEKIWQYKYYHEPSTS